jgi:hypothetical protein
MISASHAVDSAGESLNIVTGLTGLWWLKTLSAIVRNDA